jgi:hypothetical protein
VPGRLAAAAGVRGEPPRRPHPVRVRNHRSRQAPPDTAEVPLTWSFARPMQILGKLLPGPAVGRSPPPAAPKSGSPCDRLRHSKVAGQDTACRVMERASPTLRLPKTQDKFQSVRDRGALDQGTLDRGADHPVVPDGRVEGEQPLNDPGPEAVGDPAAVAFEAKLVLQRPDDCLDALPQPVRERPGRFLVLAGRADQDQGEVVAGDELLEVLPGQAFVRDEGGAGRRPVRGLAFQGLACLLAFAVQLGIGQAEPGDGAVTGADDQQLGTQYQREWLGQ